MSRDVLVTETAPVSLLSGGDESSARVAIKVDWARGDESGAIAELTRQFDLALKGLFAATVVNYRGDSA